MKKQLIGLMTILTVLGACQKNEVSVELSEAVTIHATIEDNDATKTVMDESNNILWSENDQIIAFMKSSYGHKYQVISSFIGKSYADFSIVSSGSGSNLSAGNAWDHNVVYYPFSENIECLKSGANYELKVNLPSEQVYVPDSFANGSMAMVAVSENNNITFNNVLGGIKLQLKGTQTVKSIKIEGKNNEKLSGAAVVTAYTNGAKPAITMASDASTSVALNCGAGVQLSETKVSEFIIALPPILFGSGFTVTVTDTEGQTYKVKTDKANTVLRSSLLKMPAFKLGNTPSEDQPEDDELIVPVSHIDLSITSLKLYETYTTILTATIRPRDATNQTIIWSSSNPSVASVDQGGKVTGLSSGTSKISATAGGASSSCTVTVSPLAEARVDYIDEYDINHGKGTVIGGTVWAPVNCGYHQTDYKYGKLYQWGRKYGQGYSDDTYKDATFPTIEEGGVSAITGSHSSKSNIFYTAELNSDWSYPQDGKLWNSSTGTIPAKSEYDPCPKGWRVPTYSELSELTQNHSSWTMNSEDQNGYFFCGTCTYSETVSQVFLPAAGSLSIDDGEACERGELGNYWTSTPHSFYAYYIFFNSNKIGSFTYSRALGYSVRCIQE